MALFYAKILIAAGLFACIDVFFIVDISLPDIDAIKARPSASMVANGHVLRIDIETDDRVSFAALTVYHTAPVRVYPHPQANPGTSFALVGIPYETVPRLDTLAVMWAVRDLVFALELPVRIVAGPYRAETIEGVDQSRVAPSTDDLKRIADERDIIAKAYRVTRDSVMMDGPFFWPVENKVVTSPYGTRRVFNGQLRSVHGGLDLRAREGTPIFAAQSGVVRLAQNLFYAGNHVLIEHGMGVHSGYSHLSRIDVAVDQYVEKGQQVGLAGATGRVNAAHLHWTVSIHGVSVSPAQAFEMLDALFSAYPKT
ncbi:MAG: M23 family metallopeptidase [candidate division Zixibacteria bacterium]|nr:M23 family metallopeptidase [candidate division Zixibacteria bacterium]